MSEHEQDHHDGATEAPPEEKRGSEAKEKDRSPEEEKGGKEGKKSPEKKGPGKPPKKVLIIAGLVFLVALICGVLYYLHARNYESTDDAFTTGHLHQISTRVAGTVLKVLVNDNQAVHQGQRLLTLDPSEFELGLEKAGAQLAQARATKEQAEAEVAQRQAATAQASAQLDKAQTNFDRITGLYQKDLKAVSKAEVDTGTADLKNAQGAYKAATANEKAARAQEDVAQSGIKTAETAIHDAELQLSYTTVVAPVDGSVAKKTVESGRRVQPGEALLAVVEPDVWVVANFKETQMSGIKIGQSVKIEIDALPDHEFQGHIDSFQAGTGATFSLLPPDNATGNFTKIVQRVPVKIVFDPESIRGLRQRIVPGLSVAPTIDLRSR